MTAEQPKRLAMQCADSCGYEGRRLYHPDMEPKRCTKCGARLYVGFPYKPAMLTKRGSLGGRVTLSWVLWD